MGYLNKVVVIICPSAGKIPVIRVKCHLAKFSSFQMAASFVLI